MPEEFGEIIEEFSAEQPEPFPVFGDVVEEFGEVVEEKPFAPGTAALKGIIRSTRELSRSKDFLSQLIQPFLKKDVQKSMEEKLLQKYLPTGETALETGAERVGEIIPFAAGGGPQAYIKAIIAGATGEGLKRAGAPEWAQNLAELAIFMTPRGAKKITPKHSQKEAVEFLRKKGVSEKAIAPLIKEEKSIRRLGKFSHKGRRVVERLEEAHEKLGSGYKELKAKGQHLELPRNRVTAFEDSVRDKFNELTPDQRKLVEPNVRELLGKPITARSMIDFAQDVFNKGGVAERAGAKSTKQAVKILKDPIREFMKEIDPAVAQEYKLLDKFWGKKNQITRTLKPDQFDRAIELAEAAGIAQGILTGNLNLLQKAFGVIGGRMVATELLINPRLQNLSNQMLKAAARNQASLLKKLNDSFVKEIEKTHPEIYDKSRNRSNDTPKSK